MADPNDGEGQEGHEGEGQGGAIDESKIKGLLSALDKERRARREADSKLKKFDGVDIDALRKAAQDYETLKVEIEDRNRTAEERAAAAIQRERDASEKAKSELEQRLTEAVKARDEASAKLKRERIAASLRDAAVQLRVKPQFMDDVLLRSDYFDVVDDTTVVIDGDGHPVRSSVKAGEYKGAAEFLAELQQGAKRDWFEPNSGGGARAGRDIGAGVRAVSKDDEGGFLSNLKEIAAGKVKVEGSR